MEVLLYIVVLATALVFTWFTIESSGYVRVVWAIAGVVITAALFVTVYVSIKDVKSFADAKTVEVKDVIITDISGGIVEFIYWFDDRTIQQGSIQLADVKVGDELVLGVKENIDYVLSPILYGHDPVQQLTVTEKILLSK